MILDRVQQDKSYVQLYLIVRARKQIPIPSVRASIQIVRATLQIPIHKPLVFSTRSILNNKMLLL